MSAAVRCFSPIPACHARGRRLKSCKPLLHSNERRLFGRVYDYAEMALGLASCLAPRRSRFLTHLCSRESDPASAQLFVAARSLKSVLHGCLCGALLPTAALGRRLQAGGRTVRDDPYSTPQRPSWACRWPCDLHRSGVQVFVAMSLCGRCCPASRLQDRAVLRRLAGSPGGCSAAGASAAAAARSDGPSMWIVMQWCCSRSSSASTSGLLSNRPYHAG